MSAFGLAVLAVSSQRRARAPVVASKVARSKDVDAEAIACLGRLHSCRGRAVGRWARARGGVQVLPSSAVKAGNVSSMWRAALVDAEAAVQRARAAHAEANEQEPDWLTEATLMLESLHAESEEGEEEVGGAAPRASASTDERAQLQAALDEARADAERAREARRSDGRAPWCSGSRSPTRRGWRSTLPGAPVGMATATEVRREKNGRKSHTCA